MKGTPDGGSSDKRNDDLSRCLMTPLARLCLHPRTSIITSKMNEGEVRIYLAFPGLGESVLWGGVGVHDTPALTAPKVVDASWTSCTCSRATPVQPSDGRIVHGLVIGGNAKEY